MLLAIDAGNTNIVFAVHDGKTIRAQFRASTKDSRTADEYYVWLTQLHAARRHRPAGHRGRDHRQRRAAGAVQPAPPLRQVFQTRAAGRSATPTSTSASTSTSTARAPSAPTASSTPSARYNDYGGDLHRHRLRHRDDVRHRRPEGQLRRRHHRARRQPVDGGACTWPPPSCRASPSSARKSIIGKDTVPAMQSGIFWGYIALIEGLVTRIKAEYGKPMKVIGTGGLAHLFRHSTSDDRTRRPRPDDPGPALHLRAQQGARVQAGRMNKP